MQTNSVISTKLTAGKNFHVKHGEVLLIRDGGGRIVGKWEVGSYRGNPKDKNGDEDGNRVVFDLKITYL